MLEKGQVKKHKKIEDNYKVDEKIIEPSVVKDNWYPVQNPCSIIKLIPITNLRASPTASEDTRAPEISVRDISFPELAYDIRSGSGDKREMIKGLEKKVFDYINIARLRPSFIVSVLQSRLKDDKITFKGNETAGRLKVTQTIKELEVTCPLAPFTYSHKLSMICNEILTTVDLETIEEDPKSISELYKTLMGKHGDGERTKILYYSNNNTPEDIVFDLMVNGLNGDSQRERIFNPVFKEAGLSVHIENNKVIMLLICYCQ